MRYKVPQNIDLEDKVIGPLTMKQFIYLLVGGMIVYIIYRSFDNWIGWVLIVIVSGISLAFAFLKINEMDFAYFITSFVNFITNPKIFVWTKQPEAEEIPKPAKKKKEEEEDTLTRDPEQVRSRLQVLSEVVDSQGWSQGDISNRVASKNNERGYLKKPNESKEGLEDPLKEID